MRDEVLYFECDSMFHLGTRLIFLLDIFLKNHSVNASIGASGNFRPLCVFSYSKFVISIEYSFIFFIPWYVTEIIYIHFLI